MLKIRLTRIGRKRVNVFRIVTIENQKQRESKSIVANLGFYQPQNTVGYLKLNLEQYNLWIKNGAQPTERVAKLYKIACKHTSNTIIAKNIN